MGAIRPEFGALFGPNKSICVGENLFASDSALFRISAVPFVPSTDAGEFGEIRVPILLAAQRRLGDPSGSDMYEVGTIGSVVELLLLSDGTLKTVIEGKRRARVSRLFSMTSSRRRRQKRSNNPLRQALRKRTDHLGGLRICSKACEHICRGANRQPEALVVI